MSLFAEYLNDNLLSINTTGRDDAFADKILRQAIGMKKQFPTIINETAVSYDKIFVSAGKVGFQIELYPENLIDMVRADIADIV